MLSVSMRVEPGRPAAGRDASAVVRSLLLWLSAPSLAVKGSDE